MKGPNRVGAAVVADAAAAAAAVVATVAASAAVAVAVAAVPRQLCHLVLDELQ